MIALQEPILEYTDAPQTAAVLTASTEMVPCPKCGHRLPVDALSCPHCDWVRQHRDETAEGKASDLVAAGLSIGPGLGHIYKGHKLLGSLLLCVGTPAAIVVVALMATGTAGFALFLLPIYWIAVMVHAYAIVDRVPAAKADEGEQY